MRYKLIRSDRKTLSVEIGKDGGLTVRAPKSLAKAEIDAFLEKKAALIEKHIQKRALREETRPAEPTEEERAECLRRARAELPTLIQKYAVLMGVRPTGIRVTGAVTRWGSCSQKNRLCFSWRLMRMPTAFIEYVVVHELAHIRHKNHGPLFHAFVESVLPDAKQRRALGKA